MGKDKEWEDEWGISTGLPLDDADVTIIESEFGFNPNIGTAVCWNAKFLNDDSGEEVEQSFSVGDGWEIADKGATLTTSDGKPRKLSSRSNYGRFVESALEAVGGPAEMAKIGSGFRFADWWVGTKWHLGTVKITSTNPTTKATREKDAIIVTAFLGQSEDEAPKPAKGAKGASAKASGGTAKGTVGGKKSAPALDSDLFDSLVELAAEYDDHDDFMAAALERDDVDGNKEAERAVMSIKPGSPWAVSREQREEGDD